MKAGVKDISGSLFALSFCAALACAPFPVLAEDEGAAPDYNAGTLTGDWGGQRAKLYDQGIVLEGTYKLDAWRNLSGGHKTVGAALDNLDLIATIDGEKLCGLPGSSAQLYLLNNNGGRPNAATGSIGGIDNIEVGVPAAKIYTAWAQQNFFDDKLSFLAGLYDLNTEFYATDTSGLFLNPTYGMGTEVALSGVNGPSVFPTASLGFRVLAQPVESFYVQGIVLDGVPGDPNRPKGTHIKFADKDGALLVAEAGWRSDEEGHYALGAWKYTAKIDDWTDTNIAGDPVRRHDEGYYFLADRTICADPQDAGRKLDAFFRIGFPNGDVNQLDYAWSAGAVYTGFFESRKDGQLGFAVSGSANSGKFERSVIAGGGVVETHETQLELTYSDFLTPWLTVQPDVQYTVNPGTDPAQADAWTAGVRFKIDL